MRLRRQFWNDDQFLELETERDHLFTKGRHVVFVAVGRLFDQPMSAKAAEDPRHLAAVVLREVSTQSLVLYPRDRVFAARELLK